VIDVVDAIRRRCRGGADVRFSLFIRLLMMDESTTAGRQASRSMLERRNVRRLPFNVNWSHWCRVLHASACKLTLESGLCDCFEHRHALHLTHVCAANRRRSEIDLVVTTKSFHLM
jgi:hypothetical protein